MSGSGGEGGVLYNPLARVYLSSVSAAVAESATYPIDAIKTRLQLHRSPGAGVIVVAGELIREGTMYRGLSPAVLRHLIYTPIRIVGYEHIRSSLAGGGREVTLSEKALAGGVSGCFAQVKVFSGISY
jgi:solute carrier family 25 (mitochondrial uncoupling protein), member 27